MSLEMLTDEVTEGGAAKGDINEITEPERRDKSVSAAKMKALRKVAETALDPGTVFETTAQVGPATIHLKTNEYTLFQMWRRNWTPLDPDAQVRADGAVVAAVGLENQEPAAYFCRQNGEVTLLNVAEYAECRNWTLSTAAERAAREGRAGLQAAALALDGHGTVLACPDAALLAACAVVLGLDHAAAIHNLTWTWLNPGPTGEPAQAYRAEATAYLPPRSGRWEPRLDALAGGCSLPGLSAAGQAPLPVERFVLLQQVQEAESSRCEPLSPGVALNALRKDNWATPALALPPAPGYEPVLETCLQGAKCLRMALSPGDGLRPLCRSLVEALEQPGD